MAWRPAKSLVVLREQANVLWPDRSKVSDGLIGDTAHAASASDHNPNSDGVVCAFDLTHDPSNGCNGDVIAESIRLNPHPDLKYLIWNGQIFRAYDKPGIPKFTWARYTGADPHTSHIHVSVGVGPDGQSRQPYDDTDEWTITFTEQEDELTDAEKMQLKYAAEHALSDEERTALFDKTFGLYAKVAKLEQRIEDIAKALKV